MSAHQNKLKRAARRVRDIHDYAHRVAGRRRERAHASPYAVAHHRRRIAHKFAQIRSAGAGAFAAFLAVLGPGLLAGLSDDDPAGTMTYSIRELPLNCILARRVIRQLTQKGPWGLIDFPLLLSLSIATLAPVYIRSRVRKGRRNSTD